MRSSALRFQRVLDLHPTSMGDPQFLHDRTVSLVRVRIGSSGQGSSECLLRIAGDASRAARRIAKSGDRNRNAD
jgi:hypothetical protein